MFINGLAALSSAEQFFETLKVPYDPAVVSVHRLHILKRFRDLMAGKGEEQECHDALAQAYEEFASGQGLKNFKVFNPPNPKNSFVPLSGITRK